MPVRIRYKIEISISSTPAEERDLGNVKYEIVTDKQGEGGGWKTLVAAGATDVQIPLDSIADVRFLALRTTVKDPNQTPSDIIVKFNSAMGEAHTIVPLQDIKEGHFLISTEGITSLYASNPGAVDMEMTILAAGD